MPTNVTWNFDYNGNLSSQECKPIIVRDTNDKHRVENTANKMDPTSQSGIKLQFNQSLVKVMVRSAEQNYHAQIPDNVVPASAISKQLSDINANHNKQKLQIISMIP